MPLQNELYNTLSTIHKERKSGHIFVLYINNKYLMRSIKITTKEGEIIDIVNTQRTDSETVESFWNLPVKTIKLVEVSIPDGITRNPNAPDMNRLLDRVGGTSGTVSREVAANELWALPREIDKIIAKKRHAQESVR